MELTDNIHDLIRKYNRPGPRYTSYPTAPHFTTDADKEALIEQSVAQEGPASLYIHIPFCESNCWFCGCNTIITTRRKSADAYLDLLEKEIALIRKRTGLKRPITRIHLGGGTPNFLTVGQIERLFSLVKAGFEIADDAELSVELAPNYLSEAQIEAFARNGLSRASFGVQDIQPGVQKAINRIQPHAVNIATMERLRDRGIASVNIDLIYGLPYQTTESYLDTLKGVLALNPNRLAVFNYAHVPHMKPYQAKLERHPMPAPEAKIDLLLTVIRTLTDAGYRYIGMDHFAKPDDELCLAQQEKHLHRNFQGYTIQEEPQLIALGISSISETPYSYRQNYKDYPDYERSVSEGAWPIAKGITLSEEDYARRSMIQSVMCNLHLDYADFSQAYPTIFPAVLESIRPHLPDLEKDGLIGCSSAGFEVTERGRLFLRNIAMIFDAYLGKDQAKYSRTV